MIFTMFVLYKKDYKDKNNMVKNKNLQIGKNFFVGYSPERENPGDQKF